MNLWPYNVQTLEQAQRIILTGPTFERWETETKLFVDLIGDPGERVLDFGCGVGRMAKALINRWPNVRVVGVDQSPSMRGFAVQYVASDRFEVHDALTKATPVFDTVLAIWVLPHTPTLLEDLDAIRQRLAPAGELFVASVPERFVPEGDNTWRKDGLDIVKELEARFMRLTGGRSRLAGDTAWWAKYRRRDN